MTQEQLYSEAEELGGYNAMALEAQALWAHKHRKDKEAMRIASFVWGRNARLMARAVTYFPDITNGDGYDAYWYLSRFVLAQLPKKKAVAVALEGSEKTWQLWQYRDRVDELRKRKQTTRKPRKADGCETCAKIAELFEWWSESDDADDKVFADKMRDALDKRAKVKHAA